MTEYKMALSTTEPNNYVGLIKLRQGDVASQSIQATITANGQLFKFDNLSVFFNAVLPNGNVIRDKVTEVDYINSKLHYIVADSFLQEVAQVTAWFSFENGEKIIDSTKNFQYSVIAGWKECIPQGNYIYELSEIQREIEQIIGNKDFTTLLSELDFLKTNISYLDNNFKTIEVDLNNSINDKLSQISSVPETFANLAALKSTYPNGKTGLFVTADTGHKYIWVNGSWSDSGVYQSVGIADGSINPTGLSTTIVPNNKKNIDYFSVSTTTNLYILNEPVRQNGIANITGKFAAGTIDLYLLVKLGGAYVVSDRITKPVTDGWNNISTDFYLTGDGSEFIGVIGATYFNFNGGVGFVEVSNANRDMKIFSSYEEHDNNYDLSIFPTFENINLSKKVNELENKTDNLSTNLLTDTSIIEFGNVVKDFSQYPDSGQNNSIYIPNEVLGKGNVFIHIGSVIAQTATIYILERNVNSFTVKKIKYVSLLPGENIVDMGYSASGNGLEYIGFFAVVHYKVDGGTGFWEEPNITSPSYSEGDTFSPNDLTAGTGKYGQDFSFAFYQECRESLKEKVAETYTKLKELSDITPTIKLTDFKTPKYTEIQDKTGFIGRWFDTELNGVPVKATINEGSEFYFKVKNTTTINVNFVVNSVLATPYFAYSIDGSPMTRQLITNPLLPTVNTGEHIVRVVIDGLTESEDKWVGEKGISLKDVTVDNGGTLTGILPKNKKILFHGDSITEGIRVLNMNADSTGNSATGSYPYIASTNLNAISYRVGFGASGITTGGSGGVPVLIQVIDKMTNTREAPYVEPDLVVMNMGTNDIHSTSDNFTQKLNAVLDRFTIKYSGTPIFVMVPFNQARKTELTSAVSARSNMYLVETEGWNITTTDGMHPDVAGGLVAGQKLADVIISVLGKDYFI